MGSVKSPIGCLVCLSSTENILIPAEQSKDIFNVCYLYVKDAINIEVLVKNIYHNKNKLSFCKNCLDSSANLSQLVDKLSILKKEIADFTNSFSKTIAKQRCQAATGKKNKKQFTNNDTTFPRAIQQSEKSSNTSMTDHDLDDVDLIKSEFVKIESGDIFLDSEDGSCTGNMSNEYETKYTGTEDDNEFYPFEQIDFQPNNKSKKQIGTSKSHSQSVYSVTLPNIVLERLSSQISENNNWDHSSQKEQNSTHGDNDNPMTVASEDADLEMANLNPVICESFNSDSNAQTSIGKKGIKRIRKPRKSPWRCHTNIRLRMEGKEYFGFEKRTEISDGNLKTMPKAVIRKAREMGPTCCSKVCEKAKNRHCSDFTEENRETIFQSFWKNMDWAQKRVYATSLIVKERAKHIRGGINSRRTYSFQYYLKIGDLKKQVCRQMFLSTLALRERQLHDWIKSPADQD